MLSQCSSGHMDALWGSDCKSFSIKKLRFLADGERGIWVGIAGALRQPHKGPREDLDYRRAALLDPPLLVRHALRSRRRDRLALGVEGVVGLPLSRGRRLGPAPSP